MRYFLKRGSIVLFLLTVFATTVFATVTVERDSWGVPHIEADDPYFLGYHIGQAQAEDGFGNIVFNYSMGKREVKERFDQDEPLPFDLFLYEVVEQRYKYLPETVKELLEGYVEALKDYQKINFDQLPEELQSYQFSEYDPVVFLEVVMLSRSLEAFGQKLEMFKKINYTSIPDASNQWVISRDLTKKDDIFFLMDPHLAFNGPSRWYEMEISLKGEYHLYGATFFGIPMVAMGFNDNYVWSMTRNSIDLADVILEKVKQEDDVLKYKSPDGQWIPFEVRQRGEQTLFFNKNGMVVDQVVYNKQKVSVVAHLDGWLHPGTSDFKALGIETMYEINKGESLEEFNAALKNRGIILWNLMYGDKENNIYYISNGTINQKDRKRVFRKGWLEAEALGDIIPFEKLPQVTNPSDGYLKNCNDSPSSVSPNCGISPENILETINYSEGMSNRGERFNQLIKATPRNITEEIAKSWVLDITIYNYPEFLEKLNRVMKGEEMSKPEKIALNLLNGWDGEMNRALYAPTIYYLIISQQGNDLKEAFRTSIEQMMDFVKTVKIRYGMVHKIERGDQLYPVDGFKHTLYNFHGTLVPEKRAMIAHSGSSFTMLVIIDKDGMFSAWSKLPYGQSEDPNSQHYADQARQLTSARKLKKVTLKF